MLFLNIFINEKKRKKINEFNVFNEINIYVFISIKIFKNCRFKFKKAYKKIKNNLKFMNFYCEKEIVF